MRHILIALAVSLAAPFAFLPADAQSAAREHADKAVEFVRHGDLKSAEAELRKAVQLSPGDSSLLTSLGGVLGMEGNLREANVYLAKAVELNPRDAASRRNLAANQWQLGRVREAHQNLDLLLRADPQDKIATFLLGMVSQKEKAYARSVELLESVPEVLANQEDGWVALADSCYHTKRIEQARAALDRLIASRNPRTRYLGGQVAMDARDYATAEKLFRSLPDDYPERAVVEFQIALAAQRSGRRAESEKTLLDALAANRMTRDGYLLLCRMLSADGADTRALPVATRATQAYPDSAELFAAKGAIEVKLQYFKDAVTSYERAAALKGSVEAKRDLGAAEWQAGMRERAASTFEAVMRKYPRDARVCEVYGTLLATDGSAEEKQRAVELLKHALALDDAAVEARYQLANLELAKGNAGSAAQYLEAAVKRDARDSRLHFALSRAYRRLGRESDASREMELYQKLKTAERAGEPPDTAKDARR